MSIFVLTSISHDVALLPQFLDHYSNLEPDSIHIVVLELVTGLMAQVQQLVIGVRVPTFVHEAEQRWQTARLEPATLSDLRHKLRLTRSDWYVPADLDEFIDFENKSLPGLISTLMTEGSEYAMGQYVDRLSLDRTLTPFDPKLSVHEQYPLESRVTRQILGLDDRKVVICRGDRCISSGHHRVVDQSIKKHVTNFVINHYAWKQGRRETLERRIANYARLGSSPRFSEPAQRFFKHLDENNGRIVG